MVDCEHTEGHSGDSGEPRPLRPRSRGLCGLRLLEWGDRSR